MQKFNIKEWVERSEDYRSLRQAVHIILTAVAGTEQLQTSMIMKGGLLLALSYNSTRYTKDIDFSTATQRPDFDLESFQKHLGGSLIDAAEQLGYGLDCAVQKCVRNPKNEDATFPTIQISVGYAYKGTPSHKRLLNKQASDIIRIDYSLNEPVEETEIYELEDGKTIHTYSLVEMVAEKFRALLQQEERNRIRRQDIYDLYYVLNDHPLSKDTRTKARILERFREKSQIRGLAVDQDSLANPEIRRRSQAEYNSLAAEIEGELPPFDSAYEMVETFYRGLPW